MFQVLHIYQTYVVLDVDVRSKFYGSDMFTRLTLPHSLRRAKREWSFLEACPRKDGYFFKSAKRKWSLPWTSWLLVKFKYLGCNMFARPMLSWTSLIVKSKCLGSDMFVKYSLPHTWLIVKPKYFGSAMFVKPTLFWTSLTTKFKYLESGI